MRAGAGWRRLRASCREPWVLTTAGVHAMSTCTSALYPVRVFQVRSSVPLEDATGYELHMMLLEQGWSWRKWLPPGQRRNIDIPDSYKPGDAKVWYSGMEPCRPYLLALLKAEDIVLRKQGPDTQESDPSCFVCALLTSTPPFTSDGPTVYIQPARAHNIDTSRPVNMGSSGFSRSL